MARRAGFRRRHGSPAAEAEIPAKVLEVGIRLSARPADMRRSFDALAALVRNSLGAEPA